MSCQAGRGYRLLFLKQAICLQYLMTILSSLLSVLVDYVTSLIK